MNIKRNETFYGLVQNRNIFRDMRFTPKLYFRNKIQLF